MSASRLTQATIKIPKYIERNPTDILKALASTVKYIPTEPEAVLRDDPFLLPRRPGEKRLFILSNLSGKKSARFILNKHPELFYRDDAEPKVKSFLPNEEFRADMEFTEDDIKWCIENNDAVNGAIAYKSLEEKKFKLSDETLLQFFELLCFTNEEIQFDTDEHERLRLLPENNKQLVNMTWKTSGLTSKIFNQIKENMDPSRVYSAMIAGLSKFNEHATAKQVFDDFREYHPNKPLYCSAYSGLLSSVPKLNSSVGSALKAVDDIVQHMEDNLVLPNLQVFNSILRCYRSFLDESTCKKSFQLVNDMKALNIEPSLGTYSSLIGLVARYKRGQVYGNMIGDILNHIESSDNFARVRDIGDNNFFWSVMNHVATQMNSLKLAHKLHKVYLKHPNMFLNFSYKQRYFNDYFRLIITTESLEDILRFYEEYVPMHFQPSSDCYDALAEALDLFQANEDIIKKIGQDIINFKAINQIKNDAIFKKDPRYMEAKENITKSK